MQDDLKAPALAVPPTVTTSEAAAEGGIPRRPSWLRALLLSLAIVAAGAALGGAGYRVERSHRVQTPSAERTADGWRLTGRPGRELSGLGLHGEHLIWQDGASIEYLELGRGKVLLLGPGHGMRATWDPAIGERYAVWFEADQPRGLVASAVAYDTRTGRRWTLGDIGTVDSYPSISGDLAVWCSAPPLGEPAIWGGRVAGGDWGFQIAPGQGAPVVAGDLVVWARTWTGPFTAADVSSGASWAVPAGLTDGRLTALALAGRTFVWGQSSGAAGSGVVAAVDVDGGGTTTVASSITGLAGPAFDGLTIVWGERATAGDRVMGRRLGDGRAFLIAEVDGAVKEVAVSGDAVAWIQSASGSSQAIVVKRLPR